MTFLERIAKAERREAPSEELPRVSVAARSQGWEQKRGAPAGAHGREPLRVGVEGGQVQAGKQVNSTRAAAQVMREKRSCKAQGGECLRQEQHQGPLCSQQPTAKQPKCPSTEEWIKMRYIT